MLVSGFTFVRNGTILSYPYIESIKSLCSVCDEVIVAVGPSDDDTLIQIQQIADPKIRIIETTWDEKMTDRGYTYAQQKMIAQFNCTGDWAFYLECDEIIHEKDVTQIRAKMSKYVDQKEVEALVFDYHHFYGTPDYIAISSHWYKRAPRIIRNTIRTWAPDGLFWVVMDKNKKGRYPIAATMDCHLYHYGHVRNISAMTEKSKRVERYWGNSAPTKAHDYGNIDSKILDKFTDTHPRIIQEWLKTSAETSITFNPNYKLTKKDKKYRVLMKLSKLLGGYDFSKKHFKLI